MQRLSFALALALAVASLLTACPPAKPDPAAAVVVVLDDGTCDASGFPATDAGPASGTCPVDFGTVSSATGGSHTFDVENHGTATATLSAALTLGDPAFQLEDVPASIPVGGKVSIIVDVRPVDASKILESLVITSSPPESDIHLDLSATGDGLVQHLTANPSSCSFGDVDVGQTGSCTLAIGNDGVADLHIATVVLADNPATVYSLIGDVPADATVTPGASVNVQLSVVPAVTGDVVGHILVTSDDPVQPQARIGLLTNGT
ncbi:MAG TPA: choice-of-anchor D domain-containing protein [Myxococcota bacterium]|jgi:hypothetical protein